MRHPEYRGKSPAVRGINLAFAHDIVAELEAKLAAAPKTRLHHKRPSHLRPHFFDLTAILCPAPLPPGTVPAPNEVYKSLLIHHDIVSKAGAKPSELNHILRVIVEQSVLSGMDLLGSDFTEGDPIRINSDIERPRVTFISRRDD